MSTLRNDADTSQLKKYSLKNVKRTRPRSHAYAETKYHMLHHHGYHENLISLILKATATRVAPTGHWLGQTNKKYYLKKYYLKKC